MNCSDVRDRLPALLYGERKLEEAAALEAHLASCPACRQERTELQKVRSLLDLGSAPEVQIDLPLLYRRAGVLQERRVRRWRRAALGVFATAAALLVVAVGLRLEVRLEGHQLVMRWGSPPPVAETVIPLQPQETRMAIQDPSEPVSVADADEQLRLLRELIHALAVNAEARDRHWQAELILLRSRVDRLQSQSSESWTDIRNDIRAIYVAHFRLNEQGVKQ